MSETTTITQSPSEELQSGLDDLRRVVVGLRRRRGELAGEADAARRRRDELHAALDSERATARIEGLAVDVSVITDELAAIAIDIGIPAQTVPPSMTSPGGSVITQGRPGALVLALRRLDSEIVQAEAAAATYIDANRAGFVRAAHEQAAQADEARRKLVSAADEVSAAEAAVAAAYGLAFSGSGYNPDEREIPTWGRFRPHLARGVPADLVEVNVDALVRRLGGRDRVDPGALLQLVREWAKRSARPAGYVNDNAVHSVPGLYMEAAFGVEREVRPEDLRNAQIRAAVTPDQYGVAQLHYLEPLD